MRNDSRFGYLVCALIGVLSAGPIGAQEQPQAPPSPNGSDKSPVFRMGSRLGKVFTQPVHPVVQGVASAEGIGGGIAFDYPGDGPWTLNGKAVVTPRRDWLAQLDGGYRGNRAQAVGYARVRDMRRLNFFGLGSETIMADWTTFSMRDPVVGAVASAKAGAVTLGGRVEELWPEVESGRDPVRPSIEQRFGEAAAPGLTTPSRFRRYQAFVQVAAPAADGWRVNQGGRYRIAYDVFDDRQADRFDFHRVELEGRHTFAGVRPFHTLTFHGWASSSEARIEHQVPFFLQHTLGGTSNLRSVNEHLLGGDGTTATLRGFSQMRFRDNHLLLLQAEYRFGVWGPVDATAFVDAGKTVSRRRDLNLDALKRDYGFSVSMMRGGSALARADFGFGGGEGIRVFLSLGGVLP